MTIVHALDDLRTSPASCLFEGNRHGDVDLSCFVTSFPSGRGPALHTHPYAEVFIVQRGCATFTSGREYFDVTGGHVVVIAPETPHRFQNTGHAPLDVISIHPSGNVQQTNLPDQAPLPR